MYFSTPKNINNFNFKKKCRIFITNWKHFKMLPIFYWTSQQTLVIYKKNHFWTFFIDRKLRKGRAQQTLFNLALAMLCSWVIFLVGIKQTYHFIGCLIVAILLHYFILASFMWMLMEAFLQYLTFVKVLGTYVTRYTLKSVIAAWGESALLSLSTLYWKWSFS